MPDIKAAFGILSIVVGLAGYPPYFRDIYKGATKPHLFSWIVWALIQGVAFFASLSRGGGAGAWYIGTAALACLAVAVCALFRGERTITRTDWISFAGALAGIGVWIFTADPLWAVIIVSLSDTFGFLPTIRKSYEKPFEETLSNYLLSAIGNGIGILALESYSGVTVLYPATLVLTNSTFVIMALYRRSILQRHA